MKGQRALQPFKTSQKELVQDTKFVDAHHQPNSGRKFIQFGKLTDIASASLSTEPTRFETSHHCLIDIASTEDTLHFSIPKITFLEPAPSHNSILTAARGPSQVPFMPNFIKPHCFVPVLLKALEF